MELRINGRSYTVDESVNRMTPLLWVMRDHLDLKGTKFGCGIGQCGACTLHLNGRAVRSCLLPLAAATGSEITTIEGLAEEDGTLHPLQKTWIEHDVPQCGYCQSGQIMSAAALLSENPNPSDSEIDQAMAGNICRCGTYVRIKKAIKAAGETMQTEGATS